MKLQDDLSGDDIIFLCHLQELTDTEENILVLGYIISIHQTENKSQFLRGSFAQVAHP